MTISRLEINHFRNIQHTNIQPNQHINIFYGLNGSGKTSVLEAIYYLGLGRSFRTRQIKRAINNTSENFSLFANIQTTVSGAAIPVGVERHTNGSHVLRISEQNAQSLLDVATILPLQFINSESHRLLTGGPLNRRQYLDWGVFHLEANFYPLWQRLYRALKQRNAAIKAKQNTKQIQLWDNEVITTSQQLDQFRGNYVTQLSTIFSEIIYKLLPAFPISLHYFRGWDGQQDLSSLLHSSLFRDMHLGYTQFGAHKADIFIYLDKLPVQEVLSQGQQKLVAYALRLSQGILLNQQIGKKCIYLIDDLPAELDHEKRALIAKILLAMDSQVFVTGIEAQALEDLQVAQKHKMFHVEHGRTSPAQPHE